MEKPQLQTIFQVPFNENLWVEMLKSLFKVQHQRIVAEELTPGENEKGFYYGYSDVKNYKIGFFRYKIEKGSVVHRKSGLRNLVKSFTNKDWGQFDAAVVAFHDEKHWRLSFICDLSGEKTNPKRFTFLFGDPNCSYRTAVDRFAELQTKGISFDNIKEAFSVETLTKEFYNELFAWYEWACDEKTGITFPNDTRTEKDDRENINTKIIRLITRIMFVWFIKQKELVPNDFFDEEKLKKDILNDFEPQSETSGNYYNAILQNLFFATLNREIENDNGEKRQFAELVGKRDVKTLYRYAEMFKMDKNAIVQLFANVPFLNGGLFECLDKTNKMDGVEIDYNLDGFSRNDSTFANGKPKCRAFIPNKLFFDPEKGLISILNRYNFTIEENTPQEQQVALDPELLGKVFENLLGSYNPETGETARKSSGSFYTPREIVNYMVDESLIAYLGDTPDIRDIFSHDFAYKKTKWQFYQEVIGKLKTLKILDPACGSGAFPMGILNRIVEILSKIDPKESEQEAQKASYNLKLHLIENCIYGIDIQPIAVQISKLRFFISLICNAEKKGSEKNFGIPTLPNLETKFVCANSLISKKKRDAQGNLFEDPRIPEVKEELICIRHEHFNAKTAQDKKSLRDKDTELRTELANLLKANDTIAPQDAQQFADWNPYDQTAQAAFFDAQWMFNVDNGFDIVIGNPPYISAPTQIANEQLAKNRQAIVDSKIYRSLYQKWDLYIVFLELGLMLAKENGIMTMIVPYPLTNQLYAKKLREMLVTNYNLFELVDLNGTKIFDNATVSNCIPFIKKCSPQNHIGISQINDKLEIKRIFTKTASELVQDEKTSVWNLTQEKRETARHANMNVLGDFCYISVGMVLNADEKTAKGEFSKEDLISEVKDEIHPREYIEAKDIGKYQIKRVRYLEYNTKRSPRKLSRPTFRELYENDKLIFNRLGELQVMIDDKYHFLQSDSSFLGVRWCDLSNVENKSITSSIKKFSKFPRTQMEELSIQISLKYILGIMNSKYATVLLNNLRAGDYHIYPEHIRNIPIPLATSSQQRPIISLVEKILAAKRANPQADTAAFEAEIDALVYELYGLSAEEVKVVEGD